MKSKKKISIVGAGPGGLAAGMILAYRGFEVMVFEKAERVGGRNSELKLGSYSFDLGPTFLHQKFTLDEIFAEAGRRTENELDLVKLEPMTRLDWDGVTLDTSSDPETMVARIESRFPGESRGYRRFLEDHREKFLALYACLQKPYHRLGAFLDPSLLRAAPYVLTRKSVMDVLGDYFSDPRLKLAFSFQSKYLGMSPWHCPALFSILAYMEYRYGIYHVQGGLHRISEAMARVIRELGGTIRLDAPVAEILFRGKKATGLRLEDGEKIEADAVILNADYGHAMWRLMGERGISERELRRKKYSCSTFMLYLGLDKLYSELAHHQIFFAHDYRRNVEEIHAEREPSRDFSFYVRNSSVTDPNVAPAGRSGLYILVPTINARHDYPWAERAESYRDLILQRLEERSGLRDLRSHIVEEKFLTPLDWAAGSIFLGATFNLAHTMDQLLYLRPHNRLSGFSNLYLVGGGTHPGSGLPTILESARISANLLCEAEGLRFSVPSLALLENL